MNKHIAPDPEFEKRVRKSFDKQGFMKFISAELVNVEPGICEIKVPFSPNLTQQHGFFHAGIISTLADNAAGYAAFSLMESKSSILTVEFKINIIAPAKGDFLIAESEVIKCGKTLTVCESKVYCTSDNIKTLSAISLTTLIQLKEKT